ncbi:MAG: hypothetical protein LBT64_02330, partial [Puniceicoccales bacterium]|nr:hypothetical protein [Puniceicoccales bacterium]
KQSDQAYGEQSANITANVKKWINHLLKDKTKKFKKDTLPATDTSASAKISTPSSKGITSSFDGGLHDIVKRLEIIVDAASDGREIDAKNKLTVAEFQRVSDISRAFAEVKDISQMKDFFPNVRKMWHHPQLQRDIDSCHTLYERFNAILRKEMEGSIEGDISVVDTLKDLLSGQHYGSFGLGKYIMDRGDLEIAGTSEKTQKTSTQDAFESIFRERYTIDPSKLLKPGVMEELKSIIGLSEKDLQAEFHSQKRKALDDNSARITLSSMHNNITEGFLSIVKTSKEFINKHVQPDSERWVTPLSKNKNEIVTTHAGLVAMLTIMSLSSVEEKLREQVEIKLNELIQLYARQISEEKYAIVDVMAEVKISLKYPELYEFVKNKNYHIFEPPFAKGKDLATMTQTELLVELASLALRRKNNNPQ